MVEVERSMTPTNLLKNIKDYWAILLAAFLALGFVFNYGYYSFFNLHVINYATLTELFFNMLPQPPIVVVVLLIVFIYYPRYFAKDVLKSRKSFANTFISICILMFLTLISSFLTPYYLQKSNNGISVFLTNLFEQGPIILGLLLLGIIVIYHHGMDKFFVNGPRFSLTTLTVIYFISITAFVYEYGRNKAKIVLLGKSQQISFLYNNRLQTNSDTLHIFIGETNSSIFLYNKKKKSTSVYKRDNLDYLIYF